MILVTKTSDQTRQRGGGGGVCVFSSHPFWTSSSLDVPAGVTQEEGHTGFFIHFPSTVRTLIFLARRIQPFLSLVDREVELLCTNDLIALHSLGIYFFREKNPLCRVRTHVPTCQKVTRLPLSYRGGRPVLYMIINLRSILLCTKMFLFCFMSCVRPFMAISVSVQHNGGFLPGIYTVDPMLLPPSGNPFKCHEEVLYLPPMIPPKRFDISPPDWVVLRRSRCAQIFLYTTT